MAPENATSRQENHALKSFSPELCSGENPARFCSKHGNDPAEVKRGPEIYFRFPGAWPTAPGEVWFWSIWDVSVCAGRFEDFAGDGLFSFFMAKASFFSPVQGRRQAGIVGATTAAPPAQTHFKLRAKEAFCPRT
jgi:hypothetical protein